MESPQEPRSSDADPFDVLVIGAGFGGLGAALSLAEAGARVYLAEMLRYPGGCASTFERHGFRFDAGATLVSGLGEGQLFGRWLARYFPVLRVDWMDPIVELRAGEIRVEIGRSRERLIEQLCAMPGAPAAGVRAFFERQVAVADALWPLFDDPTLLPPFGLGSLLRHAGRLFAYAPVASLVGRSLAGVLESYGLARFAPLRVYVDALCQITVQCPAEAAEAPFALAAMDYFFRGTAHVHGGVGALATALLHAAKQAGAETQLSCKVSSLRRDADGLWCATTRRGDVRARRVVANLLPSALLALLAPGVADAREALGLRTLAAPLEDAWGAAMIYAVARAPEGSPVAAHHLQLIADPGRPFVEGNHIFVSASGGDELNRVPAGRRALTISTHVPLGALRAAGAGAGEYVGRIQAAMRDTLAARAPEWSEGIEHAMTASPRTFARFVGRPLGAVGGLPRKVGLHNYRGMGAREVVRGLWLVGDSVFPGQSALSTALGGVRTAAAIARRGGR